MSVDRNLNLYITAEHPCPYLSDQQAMNLLVDPSFCMSDRLYSRLLDSGFRRSGTDVYRPHCKSCHACVSTRIPVELFKPNRSQRRNLRKNADLRVLVNHSAGFKPEYEALYLSYVKQRHAGGGMDTDTTDTFAGFLLTQWCDTVLLEFWQAEHLLGVAAVDVLPRGLSSVYTFFSPGEGAQRGLGVFAVLWQIDYARQQGLPYVYPGYWIKTSRKMAYKTSFQPIEGLVNGQWVFLNRDS